MNKIRRLGIFIFLVVSLSLITHCNDLQSLPHLLVHFIDVGYGDSILIESPCGETVLIDGGDRKGGIEVSRYLKERGLKRLSAVVISHPHPDHMDGLFSIIEEYKIERIIANEDISQSEDYASLYKKIKGKEIEIRKVRRGDRIEGFTSLTMKILHPDRLTGDLNDDSLVIRLTHKEVSFLFTGDIGQKICNELVEYFKEGLKSDVLKVPYHGKSGAGRFVREVSPLVAVVSVGPSKWGGPKEEILAEYKGLGIEITRTDKHGTIVIRTDGRDVWF
jgi:competence protein ComEC